MIQLRDCRLRLSSRNARSSGLRYPDVRVVQKASRTYETPDPTQTPSGQANPLQMGFLTVPPRKTIHVKRKTKAILRPFGCQDGVRVGSGVSQVLAAFVTT